VTNFPLPADGALKVSPGIAGQSAWLMTEDNPVLPAMHRKKIVLMFTLTGVTDECPVQEKAGMSTGYWA
jgi:hypothetical protein